MTPKELILRQAQFNHQLMAGWIQTCVPGSSQVGNYTWLKGREDGYRECLLFLGMTHAEINQAINEVKS